MLNDLNNDSVKTLAVQDFEEAFGESLSPYVSGRVCKYLFQYAEFSSDEKEKIGARWDKFIQYILRNRPKLCIHIEPVAELLDSGKLIDYLSIEYFKKRNYLEGFLNGLRQLEKEGKVRIHRAQRTYIGSLYIEGYSVVVWSPT